MSSVAARASTSAWDDFRSFSAFWTSAGSFFAAAERKDSSSSASVCRPFASAWLSFSTSFGGVTPFRSSAAERSFSCPTLSWLASTDSELGGVLSGWNAFVIA